MGATINIHHPCELTTISVLSTSYAITAYEEDPSGTFGPHNGFTTTSLSPYMSCVIYDTILYDNTTSVAAAGIPS